MPVAIEVIYAIFFYVELRNSAFPYLLSGFLVFFENSSHTLEPFQNFVVRFECLHQIIELIGEVDSWRRFSLHVKRDAGFRI